MFGSQTLQTMAVIVGLAVLIAVGLAILRHSQREAHGELDDQPEDPLASLRAAYEAGQMDEDEFHRVRESLDRRSPGSRSSPAILPRRSPLPNPPDGEMRVSRMARRFGSEV